MPSPARAAWAALAAWAAALALARAGVGALTLVDHDCVSESNINRQVIATYATLGRPKAELMAECVASINPGCRVTARQLFYLPETANDFDFSAFDYAVDAVDTVTGKLRIVTAAQEASTPVISCMGTAYKLDPTRFAVMAVEDTGVDRLARVIRKEARKRGLKSFKVACSDEPAVAVDPLSMARAVEGEGAGKVGRHGIPASVSFVPPVAGMILAAKVVRDLIAGH